jgi:hypothetical protein
MADAVARGRNVEFDEDTVRSAQEAVTQTVRVTVISRNLPLPVEAVDFGAEIAGARNVDDGEVAIRSP